MYFRARALHVSTPRGAPRRSNFSTKFSERTRLRAPFSECAVLRFLQVLRVRTQFKCSMSFSGADRRSLLALIQQSAEVAIETAAAAGAPIVCLAELEAAREEAERAASDEEQTPPQKVVKAVIAASPDGNTVVQVPAELKTIQQPAIAAEPVPRTISAWSAADDDAARAAMSALTKPRRTSSLPRMRARTSDKQVLEPKRSSSFLRRSIFGRSKSTVAVAVVPSVQVRAPQEWL